MYFVTTTHLQGKHAIDEPTNYSTNQLVSQWLMHFQVHKSFPEHGSEYYTSYFLQPNGISLEDCLAALDGDTEAMDRLCGAGGGDYCGRH